MKPTWIIGCVVAIAVVAAAWHMAKSSIANPGTGPERLRWSRSGC